MTVFGWASLCGGHFRLERQRRTQPASSKTHFENVGSRWDSSSLAYPTSKQVNSQRPTTRDIHQIVSQYRLCCFSLIRKHRTDSTVSSFPILFDSPAKLLCCSYPSICPIDPKMPRAKAEKDPNAPKRPLNAFFL